MSLSFSKIILAFGAMFLIGDRTESHTNFTCSPKIQIQYYDVFGMSSAELIASLKEHGPRDKAHVSREAETVWKIRWLENPVTCQVSITLPDWKERLYSDPELVSKWDTRAYKMGVHEWKHAEHGINAAARISKENNAERREGVIQEALRQDSDYDLKTAHGAEEGITLQHLY